MKKYFKVAAALAAASVVLASGCSSRNNTEPSTNAPSSAEGGKDISVVFVPKLQGSAFFEAMDDGGKKAMGDIPGLKWTMEGPVDADPTQQADIVRKYIQQKVDVLIIAPNDPDSMAPIIKEAQDAGIHVATADTDAPNSGREVMVNQATAQGIGETIATTLAEAMGGSGKVATVSCGETAANLNSWIEVQNSTFKEKYPNIDMFKTVFAGEDQAKGVEMATDIINSTPDLKGLIGECTTSAPAVAEAVKNAGKIGTIFTVGVGTPKAMLPYLTDGSSSGSILWDVESLGYLSAWAAVQLANGTQFQATQDVGSIKGVEYDAASKTLILGKPHVFTKDDAGNYNY
ncbi:MAG: autoinducer 2 ABC transporter substrate-binding protein [Propionicimonas sp.]|nr:autoinducer 2 ABC transporter substrate-binding protein [Propionicimonas sp.]